MSSTTFVTEGPWGNATQEVVEVGGQRLWRETITRKGGKAQVKWQAFDETCPVFTALPWFASAKRALAYAAGL